MDDALLLAFGHVFDVACKLSNAATNEFDRERVDRIASDLAELILFETSKTNEGMALRKRAGIWIIESGGFPCF
jgi:hypothetical protein